METYKHQNTINLIKRVGDKFKYMSGKEPTASRSTSSLYYKKSKSMIMQYEMKDLKNIGLFAAIVIFIIIILRFLVFKVMNLKHIIKCIQRTGDFTGCMEKKPYKCKDIKKRIYGYCKDNNKFLLGDKRGPIKKSEKCIKWIWNPKNCPLDYEKKEKKNDFIIKDDYKENEDIYEEIPCEDRYFCGNINGREIPCPPKQCEDKCKCS